MERLTSYNRDGRRVAQVLGIVSVEFVRNGAGKLSFPLSTSDPKCDEEIFQYGNLLLWEHETLPWFVGPIRVPRNWPSGKLNVRADGGASLFNRRKLVENTKLTGAGGDVLMQIIDACNSLEDLLLRPGDIWSGGTTREETMSTFALQHLQWVAAREGSDFWVRPEFDAQNKLMLMCDWFDEMGVDTGLTLEEGVHLTYDPGSDVLVEDVEGGNIINHVVGLGDSATDGKRPMSDPQEDIDSQGDYGLGMDRQVFYGNKTQETVTKNAISWLRRRSRPRYRSTARVNSSMFPYLRIGNRFTLKLHSVGFRPGGGIGFERIARLVNMRYTTGDVDAEITLEA